MTWMRNTVWLVVVLGSLWLLADGLAAGFYIENTSEALAEARAGARLVAVACLLLAAAAAYAVHDGRARWVTVGLLVPVVLCGGLTMLAGDSLLPQLSVVVAYPAALAAAAGGLRVPTGLRDGRGAR